MKDAVDRHKSTKTHHVLLLFGDDFTYTNAANSFQWLDELIDQLNINSKAAFGK
jgi:hypothetical protein